MKQSNNRYWVRLIGLCLLFTSTSTTFLFSQDIWLPTNSIDSFPVLSMSSIGDYLYAGMVDAGVYKTNDEGETWTACNDGLGAVSPTQIIEKENYLFVSTLNNGIFASTNNGDSWTKTDTTIHPKVYALASNETTLFAGTSRGVYRSIDNGNIWEKLKHPYKSLLQQPIYSLLIVGNRIFAGSRKYAYWSNDNGDTWTAIDTGINGDIRVAKQFDTDIYLGSGSDGMFKSSIAEFQRTATAWSRTSINTPESKNIRDIVMTKKLLVIGLPTQGVSIDDVITNNGLPSQNIGSLAYHKGKLYAGTLLDGVWKYGDYLPNPITSTSPKAFRIYPNPTDGQEVTLSYEIVEGQEVEISLLDNTGQELQVLKKQHSYKGWHRQNIQLIGLSPGTYYCTIKGKNSTQTKKLIIARQ